MAESGLGSPADLARMARVGASAFLIGESFMRKPDVEAAVAGSATAMRRLLEGACQHVVRRQIGTPAWRRSRCTHQGGQHGKRTHGQHLRQFIGLL